MARRFTIIGASFLMFVTLVGFAWAGFQQAERYLSLPARFDRIEIKVDYIYEYVKTQEKK